jgi:hypothetical protein
MNKLKAWLIRKLGGCVLSDNAPKIVYPPVSDIKIKVDIPKPEPRMFHDTEVVDMDIIEGGIPIMSIRPCISGSSAYASPHAKYTRTVSGVPFIELKGLWQGKNNSLLNPNDEVTHCFSVPSEEAAKKLANLKDNMNPYDRVAEFVRVFEERGKIWQKRILDACHNVYEDVCEKKRIVDEILKDSPLGT